MTASAKATMADQQEGWIQFYGGFRPVAADVMVEVFTRREINSGWTSDQRPAGEWDWKIDRVAGDIIAYRIVDPTS